MSWDPSASFPPRHAGSLGGGADLKGKLNCVLAGRNVLSNTHARVGANVQSQEMWSRFKIIPLPTQPPAENLTRV